MRMRRKAWTEPLLDECAYLISTPSKYKGAWRERFARPNAPVWMEIGCGKGVSTVKMAHENPQVNIIAIDEVRHVLAVTIKNSLLEYGSDPIDNLMLTNVDAMFISDSFAPSDGVERIIINFPNPWDEKAKHHKRRLTHPRQLIQYRSFLRPNGEIHFKTDNPELFSASVQYLTDTGFSIEYRTDDLHASGYAPNYISEHERKYAAIGLPIHFLIARMRDLPADFSYEVEGRSIARIERGHEKR